MSFPAPRFCRPEDFKFFTERGIGVTLDTLEAFKAGIDPLKFFSQLKEDITEIHLVDGFRHSSFHHPLGTGQVKILHFLEGLEKEGFVGPVIIEDMSSKNFLKSKKYLGEGGYYI